MKIRKKTAIKKVAVKKTKKRSKALAQKCLMVTTTDGRQFFTPEKNFRALVEFANVFNASISLVEIDIEKPPILDLLKLANAISDQSYTAEIPHVLICTKITKRDKAAPVEKETRQSLRTKSEEIANYVKGLFLNGETVSIDMIAKNFKKYGFSEMCYRNHMSKARKELSDSGLFVVKVKPGFYKMLPKIEKI